MSFAIEWTATALARVRDLADFIATKDTEAARRKIDRLFDGVAALGKTPWLGRAHPRVSDLSIRRLIVEDYIVIYRVSDESKAITVLTVRHGREKAFDEGDLSG
jgi:addiction module RelE/StbE family toxin